MDESLTARLEALLGAPERDVEAEWSQGRRILMVPQPRGVHIPPHTRAYPELCYMYRGTATHRVGGSTITLQQGELLFLGQNAAHEMLPLGDGELAVSFLMKPEFLGDVLQYLGTEETPLREFVLRCLGQESPYGYLHYQVSGVKPVQNLVENLLLRLLEQPASRRKVPVYTVGLLFVHLLEETDSLTIGAREQQAVLRALQYIENNYANGSLTHVAQTLHYDVAWLSREIRRRTGRTYTELVQERRLVQAAWLLRNTRQKVSDIAVAVGYENISYFHRIFAKHFGCSPKHYRDQE